MFSDATSFNGDVSNFDDKIITNMYAMFRWATSFNGDVSNFDTSSVIYDVDVSRCHLFNQGALVVDK